LHRFDLEHTFRLFKQVLGWTAPKIRDPQAAPRPRGRDSDHPPDPLALECAARRPGEVHIGGLDALSVRVREHQPEHRVGARERLGADVDVAMRSLHDLDALACVRGKAGGIARGFFDARTATARRFLVSRIWAPVRRRSPGNPAASSQRARAAASDGSICSRNMVA